MSKLSELVAVRVMGAKVIDTIDPVPKGFYVRNHAAYYGDDAGRNRCECFMPDTSIADAWRVVEKMRRDGFYFHTGDASMDFTLVTAKFCHKLDRLSPVIHHAEAPLNEEPLAICLAALRAVGVPEREIEEARKQQ